MVIPRCLLLRTGRVSVVIRKLVHHSWYGPARERPSRAGTSWKGSAGQGPAIRTRQALDRKDFLCLQVSTRYPGRIDSNKQYFHHHFMYTCLLRATSSARRKVETSAFRCRSATILFS